MNIIAIPLAYSDIYYTAIDKLHPPDLSTHRIDTIVERVLALRAENAQATSYCFLTAGHGLIRPSIPRLHRAYSLAEQMNMHIMEMRSRPFHRICVNPVTWGTRNEIKRALDIIPLYVRDTAALEETVLLVASAKPHLKRVRLYLAELLPEGCTWRVELLEVKYPRKIGSGWMEPFKLLRDRVLHPFRMVARSMARHNTHKKQPGA